MYSILHEIFEKHKFTTDIKTELNLYHKNYLEYYIIQRYDPNEIDNFFSSEVTTKIITEFQRIEEKNIRKNTSLIIMMKVKDLEKFYKENINQIMNIEEDEYYFRKYIILYDEEGVKELQNNFKYEDIFNILNKDGMFESFEGNMFFNSCFFICMELAIKIPFIVIPQSYEKYKSLEQILKETMEKLKLKKEEARVLEVMRMFTEDETAPDIKKILKSDNSPRYEALKKLYEEI